MCKKLFYADTYYSVKETTHRHKCSKYMNSSATQNSAASPTIAYGIFLQSYTNVIHMN